MNPAQANPPNPHHQPETISTADVQCFESDAFAPDDSEVQGRVRQGRPSGNGGRDEQEAG